MPIPTSNAERGAAKSMLQRTLPTICVAAISIAMLAGMTARAQDFADQSIDSIRYLASWYGVGHQGRPTANGEKFDRQALTAAHSSLPFGTIVRVTNLANGKKVLVRINDRGPFYRGRALDLSEAAARRLGMMQHGLAWVSIEIAG